MTSKRANVLLLEAAPQEAHVVAATSKGKEQIFAEYPFNVDRLLSAKAIEVIYSGFLSNLFPCFANEFIVLGEGICEGIYAKYVKKTVDGLVATIDVIVKRKATIDVIVKRKEMAIANSKEMLLKL